MTVIPADFVDNIWSPQWAIDAQTFEAVLKLAVEIAREGREGRKVGTIFTVGAPEAVLEASRSIILDPLAGHSASLKRIDDPEFRETIKELSQLDGGFVVSNEGVIMSAARYFNSSSKGVDVPLGLGSRHIAGASISLETGAVAVVVSQSSVVRVFADGRIVTEI
jgi:DNA integrity scanning protein DisA with diadenylate cyclase activity